MQTTLRLDDHIYREAKAKAAREGITLTRFLEEGLRMRLEMKPKTSPLSHPFRVYKGRSSSLLTETDIRGIALEEQEKHDLAKLGLPKA